MDTSSKTTNGNAQPGFTPGPWKANAIAKGRIIGDASTPGAEKIQINNSNSTVATVYRPRDAHLIAAAPDLYAACEKLLAFAHSVRPGGGVLAGEQELFAVARLALSRATANPPAKGGA